MTVSSFDPMNVYRDEMTKVIRCFNDIYETNSNITILYKKDERDWENHGSFTSHNLVNIITQLHLQEEKEFEVNVLLTGRINISERVGRLRVKVHSNRHGLSSILPELLVFNYNPGNFNVSYYVNIENPEKFPRFSYGIVIPKFAAQSNLYFDNFQRLFVESLKE